MLINQIIDYCRLKKGVTEDMPFDETTLALRVGNKIFALTDISAVVPKINLKCDPIQADELRDIYEEVTPGYHMNKRHWNTVRLDGKIPNEEVFLMVDHSYQLILKGLKKADREKILNS